MKNIGIDLGGTIFSKTNEDTKEQEIYIFPNSFKILSKIVEKFDNVYIISRVNSQQRERSLAWLNSSEFFKKTGISPNNLFYCFDRRDKAIFGKALELTHFIDDRPEVLIHLNENIFKILFAPKLKNFDDSNLFNLTNYKVVNSWMEIDEVLF